MRLTCRRLISRRQTAEEREAERQSANRILMSLQAEAAAAAATTPTAPKPGSSMFQSQGHEDSAKGLALSYPSLGSLHHQLHQQSHPWSSHLMAASHFMRPPHGHLSDPLAAYASLQNHLSSSGLC